MAITYRQYDDRWGNKDYNGSSTMAQAGCGPTSCATIIYNANNKVTPWTVAKFMREKGYACYGNGTYASGIPAALKHWDFKAKEHSTMTDLWKELGSRKKQRFGVLKFKAGTRGGVTWTTGGHYVPFTAYKVKNGKHYLYTRDTGRRKNDGWHCYETTMKGLVAQVWSCYVPSTTKVTTTKVAEDVKVTETVSKAEKLAKYAESIAWPCGTDERKWAYKTGAPTNACVTAMKARGYDTKPEYSDCGKCQNTVIYHVLGKKVKVLNTPSDPTFNAVNGFYVAYSGKSVKQSQLKRGDIVRYKKKNGSQHTLMYLGSGKIAEGGRGIRFFVIRKSTKYTGKWRLIEVLRVEE